MTAAIVLLALFAAAAAATGRALARNWRNPWQLVPYAILLALVDRYADWALFGGTLASVPGFVTALGVLAVVAAITYRAMQVRRLVAQYPWLYERAGPFAWRERAIAPDESRTG